MFSGKVKFRGRNTRYMGAYTDQTQITEMGNLPPEPMEIYCDNNDVMQIVAKLTFYESMKTYRHGKVQSQKINTIRYFQTSVCKDLLAKSLVS